MFNRFLIVILAMTVMTFASLHVCADNFRTERQWYGLYKRFVTYNVELIKQNNQTVAVVTASSPYRTVKLYKAKVKIVSQGWFGVRYSDDSRNLIINVKSDGSGSFVLEMDETRYSFEFSRID